MVSVRTLSARAPRCLQLHCYGSALCRFLWNLVALDDCSITVGPHHGTVHMRCTHQARRWCALALCMTSQHIRAAIVPVPLRKVHSRCKTSAPPSALMAAMIAHDGEPFKALELWQSGQQLGQGQCCSVSALYSCPDLHSSSPTKAPGIHMSQSRSSMARLVVADRAHQEGLSAK
jgi:hypothetical protein